jgi:hypothetical protein
MEATEVTWLGLKKVTSWDPQGRLDQQAQRDRKAQSVTLGQLGLQATLAHKGQREPQARLERRAHVGQHG